MTMMHHAAHRAGRVVAPICARVAEITSPEAISVQNSWSFDRFSVFWQSFRSSRQPANFANFIPDRIPGAGDCPVSQGAKLLPKIWFHASMAKLEERTLGNNS